VTAGAVLLSVAMAAAAGLVGCFAVMRRLALAGDAFAHVALPGIGVALLVGASPLLGALVTLLLGALVVWAVEHRSGVSTETVVGIVFSAALAAGALLTSSEELVGALLGSPGELSAAEIAAGALGAAVVVTFVIRRRGPLTLSLVSPEIAHAAGVRVRRLDLQFLAVFALTVGLGLRYLGVLLMGSLIIIPAATARHLARSLRQMLLIAVAASVAATLAGSLLAAITRLPSGPLIVGVATSLFVASLAVRRA
jgi:ABC-type Mn2+/Zn2+ transport system permease subunit